MDSREEIVRRWFGMWLGADCRAGSDGGVLRRAACVDSRRQTR